MVHMVPSAATWSRARHSGFLGQSPLRSRASLLGLSTLNPDETKKTNAANRVLETLAWVAEQTLHCPTKVIGLNIIFPEDLGGHISHGPSSSWALREFQLQEVTRDARRAAGCLCHLTGEDHKRPMGGLQVVSGPGQSWRSTNTNLCIKDHYLFVATVFLRAVRPSNLS